MATLLIVPGLGGSGPLHWQSRWEASDPRCVRVVQRSWDEPLLADWGATLERAVLAAVGPVVLVAHSLGAVLVAHWAVSGSVERVAGALLVAPPDVESPERVPEVIRHFAPVPRVPLPFASIVVASRDDPYACFECARELAEAWGSRLVDVGECGHINADSDLGLWPEGRALLAELV
jgi:predicted alpha/beta hydrolase family esterase